MIKGRRILTNAKHDAEFAGGPGCGSVAPNAGLGDGSHLLDHAGNGMTAILFCDGQPAAEQAALLKQLGRIDKRFVCLVIGTRASVSGTKVIADHNGQIARLFAAGPGTLYCCGPTCTLPGDGRPSCPARS